MPASARAVSSAIGEMASVEGAPFRLGDVRAALRTIVAGGTAGERHGRVQITELSRLRSRRFDTVIIGGLTAGEMPVSNSDSLGDELRALFASEPLEPRARTALDSPSTRRSRGRATQLVLVRRDADDSGAPVRPSVLWEEVVDAYRRPGRRRRRVAELRTATSACSGRPTSPTRPLCSREGRRELRQAGCSRGRARSGAASKGSAHRPPVLAELARDRDASRRRRSRRTCSVRIGGSTSASCGPRRSTSRWTPAQSGRSHTGCSRRSTTSCPRQLGAPRVHARQR